MRFVRFVFGFFLAAVFTAMASSQTLKFGDSATRTIAGFTYRIYLPTTSLYLPDPLRPKEPQESKLTTRLVPWDLCISHDGKTIGTSFLDPRTDLEMWDPSNGKTVWSAPDCQGFLACTPNGLMVISGTRFGGDIRGFDANTGKELFRFASGSRVLLGIKVTPDSKGLITSGTDGQLILWNLETKKTEKVIRGPSPKPAPDDFPIRAYAMDISPDGKVLAIGFQVPKADRKKAGNCNVTLLEISTGKTLRQFLDQADDIHSLAWSPDGNSIAVYYTTVTPDGLPQQWLLQLINSQTGAVLMDFPVGQSGSLAFSPDGRILFGIKGPHFFGWDVRTGYTRRRLIDPNGFAKKLVFAAGGEAIGTISIDQNSALVWKGQTGSGKEANWSTGDLAKIMSDMGSSLDENKLNRILESKSMENLDLAAYDLARSPRQAHQEIASRLRAKGGIQNDFFGALAIEVLEAIGDRELLTEATANLHELTAREAKEALKRLNAKSPAVKKP